MDYYVAARKDTQEVLEERFIQFKGATLTGAAYTAAVQAYKEAIAANHGTTASNISIFRINRGTVEANRIENDSAEHSFTWTADEITGIDFSAEDAKFWVGFATDKTEIDADGADTATVTVTVYQADGTTVASGVNGTHIANVATPERTVPVKFSFTNGVATKQLKTRAAGFWTVPVNVKHTGNYRIQNVLTIKSLLV